jgi:nucleoside-diphosphate-sugar epimerase
MKTALITGSAGLIGRYFAEYLSDNGWEIVSVDTAHTAHPEDCLDFFRDDFYVSHFDLVVHCAAQIGGRLGIENKAAYIGAYNMQLDGALFEWALRTRPAHVIYWSSSAAYPAHMQDTWGACEQLREWHIDHTRPEAPETSYGAVKLMGEQLAKWVQNEGLKAHVFRPFSGYASDQSPDYPFRSFIDRARRREDPFTVWGSGEQVRDFIHVHDIVSAAMAAIDQDYQGPLNLCTGVATSFNDLVELVTSAAGYRPTIEHDLSKPEGVYYRVGDPTEMLKVWKPLVCLEDGIRQAFSV